MTHDETLATIRKINCDLKMDNGVKLELALLFFLPFGGVPQMTERESGLFFVVNRL